jgi:thiol-disulfide isomerase/thioredoxin
MNTKKTRTSVILVLSLLSGSLQLLAQDPKIEPPTLLAVLFHADWCATCKVLEPKLEQVKRDFPNESVLFTQFDLTDDFTTDQSAYYAASIGLEKIYRENANKTGFVLLIDGKNKKVLGKITREKTPEEMKSMLRRALIGHPVSD